MKIGIKIKSIWEDPHMLEIYISSGNGKFYGETNCYTTRDKIENLAKIISGFPSKVPDNIEYTTGPDKNHSFFSVNLFTVDSLGSARVRVAIHSIEVPSDKPKRNWFSEFEFKVEPEAIDVFSNSLKNVAQVEVGDGEAILEGHEIEL